MTENRFVEITCAKLPLSSSELLILPSICCFQPFLYYGPCAVQRIIQSIYEKRMNAQKNSKSTTNKEIKPNRFEYLASAIAYRNVLRFAADRKTYEFSKRVFIIFHGFYRDFLLQLTGY